MNVGRNTEEIKRLLIAIQTADAHHVATGADWKPGEDVLIPPKEDDPTQTEENADRKGPLVSCKTWYFCSKKLNI